MTRRSRRGILCSALALMSTLVIQVQAMGKPPEGWIGVVERFADALLEHGLDDYGSVSSPMFAADLSLDTLRLPEQKPPDRPVGDPGNHSGGPDRLEYELRYERQRDAYGGVNLYWDTLTLRAMRLLTEITGNDRYQQAKREYLQFFLRHTPSPANGLFPWGQHSFWRMTVDRDDFHDPEQRVHWYGHHFHEFESFTPLLQEMWRVDSNAVLRFIRGIRQAHIYCDQTFVFDRHARLDRSPGTTDLSHPQSWNRHAGLYIYCFLFAYARTGDPQYVEWARGLSDLYWNARDPETDLTWACMSLDEDDGHAIPEQRQRQRVVVGQHAYWKLQGSRLVDEETSEPFRQRGLAYMRAWARERDPQQAGARFFKQATRVQSHIEGQAFALAYQLSDEALFRDHLARWVDGALETRPGAASAGDGCWGLTPEHHGKMLIALIQMHQLTGEPSYLDHAHDVAEQAVEFFVHDSGLIRAAIELQVDGEKIRVTPYEYYNNHTGVQTLVLALTQLHIVTEGLPLEIDNSTF